MSALIVAEYFLFGSTYIFAPIPNMLFTVFGVSWYCVVVQGYERESVPINHGVWEGAEPATKWLHEYL